MDGIKVVTAKEMARIEKWAISEGCDERAFMDRASEGIVEVVIDYIDMHHLKKEVTLLCGKGNNGGDAFTAGKMLLERGFSVVAYHIAQRSNCSKLCGEKRDQFKEAGGAIVEVDEMSSFDFPTEGVYLDGLCGTGFSGSADGVLRHMIEAANLSKVPTIAIDIPSGLDGNDGSVGSIAIEAVFTVALQLPKVGFYLGKGWNHVGEVIVTPFGLGEKYLHDAKADFLLIDEHKVSSLLPKVRRDRHKYEAGYLLAIAGSPGMGGAALMTTHAALRSGCGIVRLFHPEGIREELSSGLVEVIQNAYSNDDISQIIEESKRATGVIIGPGIGRDTSKARFVQKVFDSISLPIVIDADALFHIAESNISPPKGAILTPHLGEALRLLNLEKEPKERKELCEACQNYVNNCGVILVLKGAPTMVFIPGEKGVICPAGDPGMATAGSGDVLTGMIGAFLSNGATPKNSAIIGVYLHAISGEIAADKLGSRSVIASDLIDFLPEAFFSVE